MNKNKTKANKELELFVTKEVTKYLIDEKNRLFYWNLCFYDFLIFDKNFFGFYDQKDFSKLGLNRNYEFKKEVSKILEKSEVFLIAARQDGLCFHIRRN